MQMRSAMAIYRSLGRTGVQVSPLCLGAMNFGTPTPEDEARRIIDAALDGGINFIDTANVYNAGVSEEIVGRALKANGRRDEVVLATKWSFSQTAVGLGSGRQVELREATLQVRPGKPPCERARRVVIERLVGQQALLHGGEVGEVVGGQHLALDNREVDFHLIEPG